MISKEEFIELIREHKKWEEKIYQISDILKIDMWDSDWIIYCSILFEKTINLLFTEEGVNDIFWWVYEKDGRFDMKMWKEDGEEIPTETIEDLWEIVKDNRK